MKVLHVIWNLGQGGAQRYLLDLLTEHDGNVSSDMLVQASPGPLSDDVARHCGRVDYLHMKGGRDLVGLIRLIRYLRNAQVDVIHSHSNNILFNVVLQFQSRPVVYTEHGGRLLEGNLADRLIYKVLYRPIKRFIAISKYMADVMVNENEAIKERIRVIHNGVNVDSIEALSAASEAMAGNGGLPVGRKVGFVGRLVRQKGVEYFIETASHVLAVMPDVQFVIVGDGPLAKDLEGLAARYGIHERVHFLGYRKDVTALMQVFDVMLFTSRYEPFGLVIAEAMAAGVRLVAMDEVGAVSEIVRDGIDGLVIKGLDARSAADAVIRLLEDPELGMKLTANALARVRAEFSIVQNAQRVKSEYEAVLNCDRKGLCP